MSSRRKLWPFVLGLLVLVGVLCAGAYVAFRMKVAKAAAALQADALAMAAEPIDRPSHVTVALKGGFGLCAGRGLDSFVDALKDEPPVCKEFREPGTPPSKIPDECVAIFGPGNLMAWARDLMSCSRASEGGLPAGLQTPGHKRSNRGFIPWVQAAKLLAWEIRSQVASKQLVSALETCADVLATGRDLRPRAGLMGMAIASTNLRIVFPACGEAVAAADAPTRAKFHAALETIASSRVSNSVMLRDETALFGLELFGFELNGTQRDALPPDLRARIGPRPSDSFPAPYLFDVQLLGVTAMNADLRPIADLPDAERAPKLVPLREKHAIGDDGAMSVQSVEGFLRTADQAALLTQLLAVAADADVKAPAAGAGFKVIAIEGGKELVPTDPEVAKYTIRLPAR